MQKNSINLSQSQVQKHKLSLQNIQLFKLMELDVLQFEQKVNEELDLNPALVKDDNLSIVDEKIEYERNSDAVHGTKDTVEITDDYNIDISSPYANYDYNANEDDRDFVIPIKDNESVVESLISQLRYFNLTDDDIKIGEFLIGNLDENGYLRRPVSSIVDDLSFRQNFYTTDEKVAEILELIKKLDPPGIGASDLQECLLLQVYRMESNNITKIAIQILKNFFEDFSKKNFSRIIKKLKISKEDFTEAHDLIIHLNPKPTEKIVSEDQLGRYIIPDFIVKTDGDELVLELHAHNYPNLVISPYFISLIKQLKSDRIDKKNASEAESKEFISNNIRKAQTFITLVKERQETMILVMKAILDIQRDFFMNGDEYDLKPLNLKTIAEMTGFDLSTISRITSSKYIQTEYGIFPLKYFFSEAYVNEDGESVSTKVIMKKLQEIVDSEDKDAPYSDEELTDILTKEGYKIARRTTAKYRENLNIPPKYLRKNIELK